MGDPPSMFIKGKDIAGLSLSAKAEFYYGRRDHLSASLFLTLVLPIGLLEQLDWMRSFSAGVYVLR